jgi:hypothetical protein
MNIQCECGKFEAKIEKFPKNSPGRLCCYCDDCQNYLEKIGREDLLDSYGGTEIIPVYPSDIKFLKGSETLQCNQLSNKGLSRWSTTCCHTAIANTRPHFPWVGFLHNVYTQKDRRFLEKLGPIKSRIFGKFAKGKPPFKIPQKLDLNAFLTVIPFLLKGKIFKKHKNSPFYKPDGYTPISDIHQI